MYYICRKIEDMKKILIVLWLTLLLLGCGKTGNNTTERKLLKEIVIEYSKTDSTYLWYGTTKEIYRIYNCEYREVDYAEAITSDVLHGVRYYLNEYGDTIHIKYTDYTNYPRREE